MMKRILAALALTASAALLIAASGDRIYGRSASGTYHVEHYYLVDGHTDAGADTVHATFDFHSRTVPGYPDAIRMAVTSTTNCSAAYETRLEHSPDGTLWWTYAGVDDGTSYATSSYDTDVPWRYMRGVVEADTDTGCTDLDVEITFYWREGTL